MAPPDRLQLITENYFNLMGYSKVVRKAYHTLFEATFPKSIEAYNASDFVKTIEHKGIVIHDKADSINYYFEGENVTRNWANGQLISIEGSDHSLQEEEVFDYIIKEINKIESSKINS
jgi:hypothetical protein